MSRNHQDQVHEFGTLRMPNFDKGRGMLAHGRRRSVACKAKCAALAWTVLGHKAADTATPLDENVANALVPGRSYLPCPVDVPEVTNK